MPAVIAAAYGISHSSEATSAIGDDVIGKGRAFIVRCSCRCFSAALNGSARFRCGRVVSVRCQAGSSAAAGKDDAGGEVVSQGAHGRMVHRVLANVDDVNEHIASMAFPKAHKRGGQVRKIPQKISCSADADSDHTRAAD
ncbi:hypothetical protein [Stenotrophomonas tumulicola]|uniref:Uncharacterized protein n=1 Tax=Stenotrophomonas tumulicola TaxID=1685415 RepID=A0A7W3IHI1_9GAMM|nr:hypothetical protein [Stenotrophomonas tumulicola]MBA8681907.1 hypothetical protein [Stenotrophomonas tumulicola]